MCVRVLLAAQGARGSGLAWELVPAPARSLLSQGLWGLCRGFLGHSAVTRALGGSACAGEGPARGACCARHVVYEHMEIQVGDTCEETRGVYHTLRDDLQHIFAL